MITVPQTSELIDALEMKPSVLAASLGKRLVTRASRMRRAGIEPKFSRDYRAIAQLTEPKFRVSRMIHRVSACLLLVCAPVLLPPPDAATCSLCRREETKKRKEGKEMMHTELQ